MKRWYIISIPCAFLALCGCTGQWGDDSKNWKRAFGDSEPPKDVTIVHSFYRRSSFLPREEDWAFELKLSPERRKLMFENLRLMHPEDGDAGIVAMLTKDQPSWFLPKAMTNYDLWISTNKPGVFVGAFQDKDSDHVFLAGDQL